jgi:hypothetical protein
VDSLINFATLKDWAPGTFVALIVLMILTDQMVLKYRLTKVEKQRDKWQELALELLGVAKTQIEANESAVETIDKRLPTPDSVSAVVKKITGRE